MEYDVKMHLPNQIEQFLNGLTSGDERVINITIGNIKELVDDDGFGKKLDNYQKSLDTQLKDIDKNCLQMIKNNAEVKTLDDAVVIINKAKVEAVEVYNEFLAIVKSFILGYIKKVEYDDKGLQE
jgi:flagellar hook-basal body complex protein FliE